MKKLAIFVCCISLIFMCGCGSKVGDNFTDSGRFTIVSGDSSNAPYHETIIADEETGVIYLVVQGPYHFAITPLLNADGTPMLVEEGET